MTGFRNRPVTLRSLGSETMDALLKLAGDAGHEVSQAEQAAEEEAWGAARDALDRAGDLLALLRERWPQMTGAEREVIGRAAGAVRSRLDACAALLPVRSALSLGTPEHDDDENDDDGLPPAA